MFFYFESIKIDEVSAECGVCGGDQEQQHILLVNLQLKCRTLLKYWLERCEQYGGEMKWRK